MRYLNLFENTSAPLRVSQIALGCDHYGMGIPQETALQIIDAYWEQGGTLLDTARIYGQVETGAISLSEAAVGKWIASRGMAGKVVVSSKGVHPERHNMSISRITEENILGDLHGSLETLGTGHLDIWFLHRDNPDMPVGEIVDMVSPLVDQGLVRHLGASNWTARRLAAANEYARRQGRHGFAISQIQWSLALSTPAAWNDPTIVCMNGEEQAWYREAQLPVMVFSPQARGLFSKVIQQGVGGVSEKTARYFLLEQNGERIARCRRLCEETGRNPAGICLSYLTSAPFPTLPVIGCSSPHQVKDSLGDAQAQLTPAQRAYLEGQDG